MTPEEQAVKLALRVNNQLDDLFNQMSSQRGSITSSYRNAKRALTGNLGNRNAVRETLAQLRGAVLIALQELLALAEEIGTDQAEQNAALYLVAVNPLDTSLRIAALTALLAALDRQIAIVQAMVIIPSASEAQILGDDDRAGILTPGLLFNETAMLLAGVTSGVFLAMMMGEGRQKRAVAVLDKATTNCCRLVDGQTVGIKELFTLTGTPRFASQMQAPPFHWYCRTSMAMVIKEG